MRIKNRLRFSFLLALAAATAISTAAFAGCENGHTWGEWVSVGSGSTRGSERTCSVCGKKEKTMIGTAATLERIDATCTEPAYDVYCEDGVEMDRREVGPPLGHDWGEWVQVGSGADRGAERVCGRCGEKERTMIGTAATLERIDATCTEPAYDVYCEDGVEMDRREVGPALGHDWGEWVQVGSGADRGAERTCGRCGEKERTFIGTAARLERIDATCTEPAYEIYYEDDVETGRNEIGPALGHDWGEWTDDGNGACVRVCARCGETESDSSETELGPAICKYVEDATCTEPEYEVYYENGIETMRIESSPALGHDWGEWKNDPYLCASVGYDRRRVCERCGAEQTEHVGTGKHDLETVHENYENRCVQDWETIEKCKSCGLTLSAVVNYPIGHSFGDWTVSKKATVFEKGESARTCRNCGKTETKSVAKLKAKVSLNVSSATRAVGQVLALKATGLAEGDSVAGWSSSAPSTVSVSNSGKATPKRAGTAYVTVRTKAGAMAQCRVTVKSGTVRTTSLSISGLRVKNGAATLKKGKRIILSAFRKPTNSTQPVTWKSSNPKVASVSNGKVTGLSAGKAMITAVSGTKTAAVVVTVTG